jgi:hypothetical protein
MQIFLFIISFVKSKKMSTLEQLKTHLQEGQVYRRSEPYGMVEIGGQASACPTGRGYITKTITRCLLLSQKFQFWKNTTGRRSFGTLILKR